MFDQAMLSELVRRYFDSQGKVMPDVQDAAAFLTTEAAEALDESLRLKGGYVRNHDSDSGLAQELGDVLLMLIVTSHVAGVNPLSELFSKMESKGFSVGRTLTDMAIREEWRREEKGQRGARRTDHAPAQGN